MLYAVWEEVRPDLGLIRVGENCRQLGDPFDLCVIADAKEEPVELKGLGAGLGFTRDHHDAIGLCLLNKGFNYWQRKRYKNGVLIPPLAQSVHLSATFIKELAMSIESAHAHAVTVLGNAIAHANKNGHTDLAAALTNLGAVAEAGIPAGQGSDLAAQGDALQAIFHALVPVVNAGLAIQGKDPVHSDVLNLYNAMENVANAIHAANKARMHAALAG